MGGSTLYVEAARVDAGEGTGALKTTGVCLGSHIIRSFDICHLSSNSITQLVHSSWDLSAEAHCTVVVFSCKACN